MAADYLETGRTNQKWRTRQALLDAANALLRDGRTPTVAEVADAARVARTTAYRYFPTQKELIAGAMVMATLGTAAQPVDAAAAIVGTPSERLDAVVRADWQTTTTNETVFRAYLSEAIAGGPEGRPGNRVRWVSKALETLKPRLGAARFAKLVNALTLCLGIESLITLRDVCRLAPDAAEKTKRWAAQLILKAALDEPAPRAKRSAPRNKRPAPR